MLIIIILCTFTILIQLDEKIMPSVISITENHVRTRVNRAIDSSVNAAIKDRDLTSSDFFQRTFDEKKETAYLNVDTLLINEICSEVSVRVSEELVKAGSQKILIPIGALSGSKFFSNFGPKLPASVLPVGSAEVDYYTSFESVGINQVNFQVWLSVQCSVDIAIPLQNSTTVMNRKLMLVNTVYNGDVPSTYLQIPNGVGVSGGVPKAD